MNERIKRWIIEADRRGESWNAIRVQVRNTFDTKLTFWEIQDICDEANTGMSCVCGYIGNDFPRLLFLTRFDDSNDYDSDARKALAGAVTYTCEQRNEAVMRTIVYACPKCGTLRAEV